MYYHVAYQKMNSNSSYEQENFYEQKSFDYFFQPPQGRQFRNAGSILCQGAQEAGHSVETVYLREKKVGFCKGCLACLKVGHCVIADDAVEIAAKMHDSDVIVFATPVYYYSVSGQLKTVLDRANPR